MPMLSQMEEKLVPDLTISLPPEVFSAIRRAPDEFVREMRVAAAAKWYELGEVSQGKAAAIAGLSRAEFIDALGRNRVSPFQYTGDDIARELGDA
jgi:predicted HTH domain antitoxin